jgi:hypothetical protein
MSNVREYPNGKESPTAKPGNPRIGCTQYAGSNPVSRKLKIANRDIPSAMETLAASWKKKP